MELECLPEIPNIRKTKEVHEFFNKLARVVIILNAMKKLKIAQARVYIILKGAETCSRSVGTEG